MAGSVGLSQALSYARDLKSLYETSRAREQELERAQERLRHAYAQSRQYAVDLRKTYRRLQHAIFQSLLGLANALEAKDPYTRGHSERVATLARRVARAAGVSPSGADTIAQAGLLHDLGKIGIPEQVLRKPGPLDPEEWAMMRRHPIVGAQIVAPLEFFADGAIIVRHHHERHDGSGYPDGLRGQLIPLGSRIVAVADVYDALTSDRPYRPRLSRDEAVRRLQAEAGRTLDAHLTTLCIQATADAAAERAV
ncbi:MAG TPA: HD domain-containing phosphohydrolase [Verrucomicrobiae bacterium]|jgi:HD-GYP domain-containing protein (c-di-GMP phosphodiesterase class II)|nr:HD domain-containing phosphohydrolase [Verrucomicrobiae bacterium]